MKTTDFISPEMLVGPNFQISPEAYADGTLVSFSMWTPYGWYRPESLAMLNVRRNEVRAITALTSMQQDPLFVEGMVDSAGNTVAATVGAVTHPVQTLRNIPLGLERFGQSVQARANTGKIAGESGSTLNLRAKRELALSLGVDPYSANPQLQNLLNTVAAHKNAGALTARISSAFVGGGSTVGIIAAAKINKSVQSRITEQSAPTLQEENAKALAGIGADQAEVKRFLYNDGYTATDCTIITDAIVNGLATVRNIGAYVGFIQPASAPEIPLYHRQQIRMAAFYNRTQQPLVSFSLAGDTAIFTNQSGAIQIFAPLDYLMWTEGIAKRVDSINSEKTKVDVWITGTASPVAKEKLEEAGIKLHERAGSTLFTDAE